MTVSLSKKIGVEVVSLPRYSSPCLSCNGRQIKSTQNSTYYIIHGRIGSDRKRDHFLAWTVKPEKQHQQQVVINQLWKSSVSSRLEQNFLEGLKSKKVSLKQQEILSQVEVKGGQG